MIRRRLYDPACPLDYPALSEFKGDGGTDYARDADDMFERRDQLDHLALQIARADSATMKSQGSLRLRRRWR